MVRNLGGIGNIRLFDKCYIGTKKLIEEYNTEVVRILDYIANTEFENYPIDKKFDLFYELRHTFGRSALLLSGGSALGNVTRQK